MQERENLIRTYKENYSPSDDDSELEAKIDVDSEIEDDSSIANRLEQNIQYLNLSISNEQSSWLMKPQNFKSSIGEDVILVMKPTASNMSHRFLNPFIYRNIKNGWELERFGCFVKNS